MKRTSAAGLKPEHFRALRIVEDRAATGEPSRAEDIRWDDFSAEVLARHPYLKGKRDEKLKEKRAPSILLELLGAGLIRRSGGEDSDPHYLPSAADKSAESDE